MRTNPVLKAIVSAALILAMTCTATLLLFAVFVPPKADAAVTQVEKRDRPVKAVKVVYAERLEGGRLYYELNNGATFVTTACQYEDSRNCWWNAGKRGNGVGHSFVDLKGRALYLDGLRIR